MAIPYLPHMCEDALKERRGKQRRAVQRKSDSTSSFDQEVMSKMEEVDEREIYETKRDSVGR